MSYAKKIKTHKVWYHSKTRVVDVGTDHHRATGMKYFSNDLNRLAISKTIGAVVTPQKGYVPPPLIGIWARWPYFHNNSAPTLWDVLTPDFNRPKSYIAVPAESKKYDFDILKNGYPSPDVVRAEYRDNPDYLYDSTRKGLSNIGHTSKILLDEEGREKFSTQDKLALIEFLKSL